jgi:hypothetical protein
MQSDTNFGGKFTCEGDYVAVEGRTGTLDFAGTWDPARRILLFEGVEYVPAPASASQ